MDAFWQKQLEEAREGCDFNAHHIPLARIKTIMRSDSEVRFLFSRHDTFNCYNC